jgi:hypothetical protein
MMPRDSPARCSERGSTESRFLAPNPRVLKDDMLFSHNRLDTANVTAAGFSIQGDWGLAPFDVRQSFSARGSKLSEGLFGG